MILNQFPWIATFLLYVVFPGFLAAASHDLESLPKHVHSSTVSSFASASVPCPVSEIAIPEVAKGYEEIYRKFVEKGKLIYRPKPESDEGKIELLIRNLANPLDGTFDLSRCGYTGNHLSISTGYRKAQKAENAEKDEVWITPHFVIKRELATTAKHLKPIMGNWDAAKAPVGLFWTRGYLHNLSGDRANSNWYDYLVTCSLDGLGSENLYKKWAQATRTGDMKLVSDAAPIHRGIQCFTFELNLKDPQPSSVPRPVSNIVIPEISSTTLFSAESDELLERKNDRSFCIRNAGDCFCDYRPCPYADCFLRDCIRKISCCFDCRPGINNVMDSPTHTSHVPGHPGLSWKVNDFPTITSSVTVEDIFNGVCYGVCCFPLNVVWRTLTFPWQDSVNCCDVICARCDALSTQDKREPRFGLYMRSASARWSDELTASRQREADRQARPWAYPSNEAKTSRQPLISSQPSASSEREPFLAGGSLSDDLDSRLKSVGQLQRWVSSHPPSYSPNYSPENYVAYIQTEGGYGSRCKLTKSQAVQLVDEIERGVFKPYCQPCVKKM